MGGPSLAVEGARPIIGLVYLQDYTECQLKLVRPVFKDMGLALRLYMEISCDGVQSNMLPARRPCFRALTLLRSICMDENGFLSLGHACGPAPSFLRSGTFCHVKRTPTILRPMGAVGFHQSNRSVL